MNTKLSIVIITSVIVVGSLGVFLNLNFSSINNASVGKEVIVQPNVP